MKRKTSVARGINSIGNKMLAALVAVAVLPTVTVAVYAIRQASSALVNQALYRLKDNTSSGVRLAQDTLRQLHDELPALVAYQPLINMASFLLPPLTKDETHSAPIPDEQLTLFRDDMTSLERSLRQLLSRHKSCVTIQLIRPQGRLQMVLRVEPSPSRAEVVRTIDVDLPNHRLDFDWDLQRMRPLDEKISVAFTKAVHEHPDQLIHRFTLPAGRGSGDALEVFAAHVRNEQKHSIAYLIVALSWSQILQDMVDEIAPTPFEATDPIRVTLFDHDLDAVESLPENLPFHLPESLWEIAKGGEAEAALTKEGELIAFAPVQLSDAEPRDLLVLALNRSREHLRHVDRFRYVFSAVLIGALMLALALGTYLSRRLTRPLKELRDSARIVGGGKLELEVIVDTRDEVEEVASEFNAMTAKLRSLYESLEDTIRERTNQLQNALDDLRTAHQNLLDSEARYSDIVENASDMIQVTDEQGLILSVNRRQTQLLAIGAVDVVGRRFLDFVSPARRASTRAAFDAVLQGETLTAFSSTLLGEGGRSEIPVEISATPVWRDGAVRGVRAILRDVGERKQFETQLIKAERLSSVGALAAGVAHEINNPLGIITMFAQRVLEKARKGDIDVDKIEKILEQARRVATITRGLLDFSRAGPNEFQKFDPEKLIRDTLALVQERAQRSNVSVGLEVPEPLPALVGNHQQVAQVLLNLLLNALHAVRKDGSIRVRAEKVVQSRLPGGRAAVRISVRDSGPGIAAAAMSHLFEPFFTTKAPGEGTGLGLSVSYGIIKDHQGVIWAENGTEGGAHFQLELPLPDGT